MRIRKCAATVMLIVAAGVSATAFADPTVEELAARMERMQQEMDKLQQQLRNSATKDEVRVVRDDVATAGEWRQPDTLIHMAGYASVGYSKSESGDGSFNVSRFSPIFHFQYNPDQ